MKIFLEDDELDEIDPIKILQSSDKGKVITPTVGKRGDGLTDERKEIIANDVIDLGPTKAAEIHGISIPSASKYGNGQDITNRDIRAGVIARKNDIENVAVVKLMDTLNLIDPAKVPKVRDKIALMTGLSNLVDKIGSDKDAGKPQVHLHLHAPTQKKESDYEVIDV